MPSAVDVHFPDLAPLIEEWWRGTHDPGVPPHITLLYPWVDAVTDDDLAKVRRVASANAAFEVSFTGVAAFAAGAVYLRPEPDLPLRRLMSELAREFPGSPLYGGAVADPVPHLTVARTQPGAATERMCRRIAASLAPCLPLTASVSTLAVMEQLDDRTWLTRTELALGGNAE